MQETHLELRITTPVHSTSFEQAARAHGFHQIAGVDEAGRGPLAGPVVAAACIMAPQLIIEGVDDSKVLTEGQREKLFTILTTHPGVNFGVGVVDHAVIDQINILQATMRAMRDALDQLNPEADCLLVDGLFLSYLSLPCQKIIKGDQRSQSIAAASIIAKVTRDRMMIEYDEKWPQYGFKDHKGYGTAKHRASINAYGPCPIHRLTFEPLKSLTATKQRKRIVTLKD